MKKCLVCAATACKTLIDFGEQPICHHFYGQDSQERTFPLIFGQCQACGLSQLIKHVPAVELVPRYNWISYNEPEAHLDRCVKMLSELPGIGPDSVIWGLTYKEDSTLKRFKDLGFRNTRRLDFKTDLNIEDPKAGIETFQKRIQPSLATSLRTRYGAPDMIIARHVLEHAAGPHNFMEALRQLVKSSGYVVFEVPDCGRAFDLLDYTTLWEDHSMYFVRETFLATLEMGGYEVDRSELYSASYENCLVAVARPNRTTSPRTLSDNLLREQMDRSASFAERFPSRKVLVQKLLQELRRSGNTAIFGAGHQSAMFINLMGVAELIEAVLDDHPQKKGLRMPGSRLPIVGSEILATENFNAVLSSLSAESERKVAQKHAAFLEKGGIFASIFPTARFPIFNHIAGREITAHEKWV